MDFLYNFFKWTRKTTVVVLSFISLALVTGIVVGCYYLRDGDLIQQFLKALNDLITNASQPGAPADLVPEFLINFRDWLSTSSQTITDVVNGVFIGGIAFLSVFVVILIGSFITWLVYLSKSKSKDKAIA